MAAHQGWYIPAKREIGGDLIVPGGQANELWDARRNPYGWLERNKPPPGATPKPLDLGRYPAYVKITVNQPIGTWKHVQLLGIIIIIFTGVLTGWIGVLKWTDGRETQN